LSCTGDALRACVDEDADGSLIVQCLTAFFSLQVAFRDTKIPTASTSSSASVTSVSSHVVCVMLVISKEGLQHDDNKVSASLYRKPQQFLYTNKKTKNKNKKNTHKAHSFFAFVGTLLFVLHFVQTAPTY
jgi:hypothetical protein